MRVRGGGCAWEREGGGEIDARGEAMEIKEKRALLGHLGGYPKWGEIGARIVPVQ